MKRPSLSLLFLSLVVFGWFVVGCKKDDDNPAPSIKIDEFLGDYALGQGSFYVMLDANNNELPGERRDISGEIVKVSRGQGDTLILSSPTLGSIKAAFVLHTSSGNPRVNLTIPQQVYSGNIHPAGLRGTLFSISSLFFEKVNGGKFLDVLGGERLNIVINNPTGRTKRGNRYQVSIIRGGIR
ncbi:MAG: hypothetical protein NZ519_14010 [Bacteroidia bacterium]|nr:hypothetical protein [Bacteroidia bacterium]MDW8303201.1 hypothetical protein [Bacteroidia bacterium]